MREKEKEKNKKESTRKKREKRVSNVIQKLYFTLTPLFSFALCEQNDPNKPPTKECFMKYQLTVNNQGSILVLST